MRATAAVCVCVLAAAAPACGAAAQNSPRPARTASPQCAPSRARTVVRGPKAVIYATGGRYYGCTRARRNPVLLGSAHGLGPSRVGGFVLSGTFVGYYAQSCAVDTCSATVDVTQLTNGARVRQEPAYTGALPPEGQTHVASIVLRGSSVAWIAAGSSIVAHVPRNYEVQRADRRGPKLLDSGERIDPRSLILRGSRLRWRDGSRTRTSSLR